jgi:hypothetical protein
VRIQANAECTSLTLTGLAGGRKRSARGADEPFTSPPPLEDRGIDRKGTVSLEKKSQKLNGVARRFRNGINNRGWSILYLVNRDSWDE